MLAFIIICMVISPFLGIPWLCMGLYQYRKRDKINLGYSVPFAMLFGTMGYSLRFKGEMDLTRYYRIIDGLEGRSLRYILNKDRERLYTKDILFYFVSKTGNNNILAYIVGFFIYLIIFYVFFDTINRYKYNIKQNKNMHVFMMGLLMISIVNPYVVIANVRCVLSYVIIVFAAYREWIQKKRNIFTFLLYILPIGLHVSTILILITRICVPFIKKYSHAFVLLALLIPAMIRGAYEIIIRTTFNSIVFQFVRNAIYKANRYLLWRTGGYADTIEKSISNTAERIYGVFFLLVIICLYQSIQRDKILDSDKKFYNYLFLLSILALGCLSIKTGVFWRFEVLVVFFSPCLLALLAARGSKNDRRGLYLLYLSVCAMFIYNIARFIRNVKMGEFCIEYIGTSTLKIIWEMLKGLN